MADLTARQREVLCEMVRQHEHLPASQREWIVDRCAALYAEARDPVTLAALMADRGIPLADRLIEPRPEMDANPEAAMIRYWVDILTDAYATAARRGDAAEALVAEFHRWLRPEQP